MDSPILFLVFNRPDNTRLTFERIREARPPRLYVHADGARPHKTGEAERCAETRAIFNEIDWPCEVHKLFREDNWGVKRGLSDAISWFFKSEKQGIILEDDCLADPSFFLFCDEILAQYADNERVMHVSGHNWVRPESHGRAESYLFTNYSIVSAWASWARAWKQLDLEISGLEEFEKTDRWQRFLPGRLSRFYLMEKFRAVRDGRIDSWAFPWFYSVAKAGGLGIVPRVNLVENIGINRPDATNTSGSGDPRTLPAGRLEWPLAHPVSLESDPAFDQELFFLTHKKRWRLWLWALLFLFRK